MVGLDNLKGFFQPKQFYDYMILNKSSSIRQEQLFFPRMRTQKEVEVECSCRLWNINDVLSLNSSGARY